MAQSGTDPLRSAPEKGIFVVWGQLPGPSRETATPLVRNLLCQDLEMERDWVRFPLHFPQFPPAATKLLAENS